MGRKDKRQDEEIVEEVEVTPYDNMQVANEPVKEEKQQSQSENKQINLSFSMNSFSSILAIISLGFTFLFTTLYCFGVNVFGVTHGIFFLISSIFAVVSFVFAYKNSGNKLNMPLAFSVLTILITVIVYI